MKIPIHQFEHYIDEPIIRRGFSCFENGAITEFAEISPGFYEARVRGTELYSVSIQIAENTITEYSCDCPYDLGPVCKHIAAAIFYLQRDRIDLHPSNFYSLAEVHQDKYAALPDPESQVDCLLNQLSHNELKQFIRKQTGKEKALTRVLISTYSHLLPAETKRYYNEQIDRILTKAAGREGYIKWGEVNEVGYAVDEIMDAARNHYEMAGSRVRCSSALRSWKSWFLLFSLPMTAGMCWGASLMRLISC